RRAEGVVRSGEGVRNKGFAVGSRDLHPNASGPALDLKILAAGDEPRADRSLRPGGHPVVLTSAADPAELELVGKIVALSKAKTISLAGTLSVKELGALTARARLFVGVDSMPMHLAAAMGTPTVALFGPSGENEWGPWNVE